MSEIEESLKRLEVQSLDAKNRSLPYVAVTQHHLQTVCQALRGALKDKERLDWLCDSQDGCNEWETVEKLWREGMLLREAVDAAMTPTPTVKQ